MAGALASFGLEAKAEHGLQIVLRELLEGDHGLRPFDSVQPSQLPGYDRRQLVVLSDADDRDKVPLTGHGVDLGHAGSLGQLRPQRRKPSPRGLNEHDRGQHSAESIVLGVRRMVRDDPEHPDPAFVELYGSIPDAVDLEPWLGWCRRASGTVLYLGVGAGRLAVPLAAAGIELVGVDAHPGMLERLQARMPGVELVQTRIEDLDLDRRFPLVIGPSSILESAECLAIAARHSSHRVAMELMNPHWLLDAEHPTVRVLTATAQNAEIEVDYPGGWTQSAAILLRWPEDIESFLGVAGLRLEDMRGRDADGDLSESSAYYVLARTLV